MKKHVQLTIGGMHCDHCVEAVRGALTAIPGAHVAHVEIGSAALSIDDSGPTIGALIDAVYDAGYEAEESPT